MAAHSTRQTLYGTVAGMTMYHQMLECCWQTRMKTANSEIQEAFRFLVSMQRYSFSSKVEYNHEKSTAQGALVKGYSAIDDFGDLLGCFWKTAMEHELAVYVDRFPTDSNVSDGPSRSRFQELEQMGCNVAYDGTVTVPHETCCLLGGGRGQERHDAIDSFSSVYRYEQSSGKG